MEQATMSSTIAHLIRMLSSSMDTGSHGLVLIPALAGLQSGPSAHQLNSMHGTGVRAELVCPGWISLVFLSSKGDISAPMPWRPISNSGSFILIHLLPFWWVKL